MVVHAETDAIIAMALRDRKKEFGRLGGELG